MVIKRIFLILLFITIIISMSAQKQFIKLYPNGAPNDPLQMTERFECSGNTGGKTVQRLSDVSEPGITVYQPPIELSTGTAVIVCPGGGYEILAYDLEGIEVCVWLNNIGITAILLKYRVPRREGRAKHEAPLEDAQRAMRYVRMNHKELRIKSDRIGVMGFSAGAHLSTMLSNELHSTYPLIDEMDQLNTRPNFCILVYPAYLDGEKFQLSAEINPSANTPPTLLIQAEDDKAYINSSIYYYYALKELNVPTTMHLYPSGGHGYGLRNRGILVDQWPIRAEEWLKDLGMIK